MIINGFLSVAITLLVMGFGYSLNGVNLSHFGALSGLARVRRGGTPWGQPWPPRKQPAGAHSGGEWPPGAGRRGGAQAAFSRIASSAAADASCSVAVLRCAYRCVTVGSEWPSICWTSYNVRPAFTKALAW